MYRFTEKVNLTTGGDTRALPVRILADTSIIWDALSFQLEPDRMKRDERRLEDAKAFWQLLAEPRMEVYYTSLLEHNLSQRFPAHWQGLKSRLIRTPIPLSRADGYHKADGSIMGGGTCGGSLRLLLSPDHEGNLIGAAKHFQDTGIETEYKKHRKGEFDYEHLEAALEVHARYFITTDYALLGRLKSLTAEERKNPEVQRAATIAVRPVDALRLIGAM